MAVIKCRAKLSPRCLDGEASGAQFGGENLPLHEDGTFDGETIVCDPCYVILVPMSPSGAGLKHELDETIDIARLIIKRRDAPRE